jgi:DNA-binding CsgD family transcriptional regulator/PAS domain-containing protein
MNSAQTQALLGAIAPLHEAPQDTGAWSNAMAALAQAIPCEQASLVERLGPSAGAGLGLVVGTDTRFVGEYQREYHRIDPFASDMAMSRLHDLGRAALSGEVLQDGELQGSPYQSQFLSRYGDLFHGVGGAFAIADEAHAHIWLLRPRGKAFDESERRRMDLFFAHARAALRQRRWLVRMARERDAALAWLDCWSDATFVLDPQGGLVIANVVAERLLRSGEVLCLRGGKLRPARAQDPDWLGPLLAALVIESRTRGGEAMRCLALPRRDGQPALHAVLTTLPASPGRIAEGSPNVALVLRDLRQALPQFEGSQLRDLFGFTTAESRVANALLSGQSVEDIATASQVRSDTVRAHVKRMLAKTGTRRQGDLQKLLVKALPNLRNLHAVRPEPGEASG